VEKALPPLAIGALSRTTGVNIETMRYYERVGLLPAPPRSLGGYRLYGHDHVRRLFFIRRARALGFALDEVRALFRLADRRERSCAAVRDLAGAHLADVRGKIADLRRMERILVEMVAACADGTLPDCPLIGALYRAPPEPTQARPKNVKSRARTVGAAVARKTSRKRD
jgi:MerR family mercuric resistance operon transcriptional regulator